MRVSLGTPIENCIHNGGCTKGIYMINQIIIKVKASVGASDPIK